MESLALVAYLLLAGLYCLVNPIGGLKLVVVSGFLQDPVRKLLPGNAFFMVLGALVIFGFCFAGLLFGRRLGVIQRSRTYARLRVPISLFVLVVVVQSVNSFLRWESPVLAGIGLMSYLGPLAAGAVGYVLGLRPRATRSLLETYAKMGLLAGASVLLARAWPGSKVLSPIGEGMMVYGENIGVRLASGLMRTAEVASWHSATAACVWLLLLSIGESGRRSRRSSIVAGLATTLLLVAVVLTGRRKAIVEVAFFLLAFGFFLFRRRMNVKRLVIGLGLAAAFLGVQLVSESGLLNPSTAETAYLTQRSSSILTDSGTRLSNTVGGTLEVFRRYGWAGLGAGSIAQGSQYFGADQRIGRIAEAGLARIAAELGLAGLLVTAWVALRLVSVFRRGLGAVSRQEDAQAKLGFGLLSIVIANGFVFFTASQIFGDPFVYLVLGLFGGAVLGLIDGASAEIRDRRATKVAAIAPLPPFSSAGTPDGRAA